jgi:hypothetical protein
VLIGTNTNNSIQFFVIYVLSQQLYGQLQTQHSVLVSNYIVEQYNIAKGKLQASTEENTLMRKSKQTNKQR